MQYYVGTHTNITGTLKFREIDSITGGVINWSSNVN